MNEPLLKVYGERNSGTNYLNELIDRNLLVRQLPGVVPKNVFVLQGFLPKKEFVLDTYFLLTFHKNLGWKHSLVKPPSQLVRYQICSRDLCFVTITKNPYSWLLSLYQRPYHQYWEEKPDFDTFLTTPWRNVGRANAPREFSSPVELWNQINASYIRLQAGLPTLTVRYEDLISDPHEVVKRISEGFSYKWRGGCFVNLEQSTKEEGKDFTFYQNYYLLGKWKDKLSEDSIRIINESLNMEVVEYFKYEPLT